MSGRQQAENRSGAGADAPAPPAPERPLVEVGWVLIEPLDRLDRAAVLDARVEVEQWLSTVLPRFAWSLPLSDREERLDAPRVRPTQLVDLGTFERDTKRWDFVFVVTGAELTGLDRRFALGATSRCMSVGVASTLRLDPAESRQIPSDDVRRRKMADRLVFLFARCFAVLNGLEPSELGLGPGTVADVEDLDRPVALGEAGRAALDERLERVADPRVEEAERPRSRIGFYWRAVRADPGAIPSMLRWARPWLFPFRLSRMSAAALSVLFILLMTAEAWELGVSRDAAQAVGLAAVALAGTTGLVLSRQGILARGQPQLTEQTALSNLATALAMGLGLFSTFFFLVGTAFLASSLVFSGPVTAGWAQSEGLSVGQRVVFSIFVAAVGIIAGALGASFEEAEDFLHIARIDREL